MMRRATLILCVLDLLGWALILFALFRGPYDPYAGDFSLVCAIGSSVLFALTALPAILLHRARREPKLAFVFALAFPVLFILVYGAVTTLMV